MARNPVALDSDEYSGFGVYGSGSGSAGALVWDMGVRRRVRPLRCNTPAATGAIAGAMTSRGSSRAYARIDEVDLR